MIYTHANNSKSGFSVVEVLVSMTILAFVLTGVVQMFTTTGNYHTAQEMLVTVAQDLRAAKHMMVYEIREAGCNPDDLVRMGLQLDAGDDRLDTDSNSIHFLSDIDNGDGDSAFEPDGDADDPNENIAYYRVDANNINLVLNNGNPAVGILMRNAGGVQQQVMGNVTDLSFTYFDQDNNAVGNPNNTILLDSIRSVQVSITGQVENPNGVNAQNTTWTQQFTIKLRNT